MAIYIATIAMWITLLPLALTALTNDENQQQKPLLDPYNSHTPYNSSYYITEESARRKHTTGSGDNDGDHTTTTTTTTVLDFRRRKAGGVCPANKNAHVLYITTNIGQNIYSFDSFGRYLGPVINLSSFPKSVVIEKLRGIKFGPDGLLYVSSGMSSYSRIFAISPNGLPQLIPRPSITSTDNNNNNNYDSNGRTTEYEYSKQTKQSETDMTDKPTARRNVIPSDADPTKSLIKDVFVPFVTNEMDLPRGLRMNRDCTRNYVYTLSKIHRNGNPNLDHPYDFVFHPDNGVLFVSNQNSITITRYVGPTTTFLQIEKIIDETISVITTDANERLEIRNAYMNYVLTSKREEKNNTTTENPNNKETSSKSGPKSVNFQVAPVEFGDPMPFSGGVSGLAGLPLPMPSSLFNSLKWKGGNVSSKNNIIQQQTPSSSSGELPTANTQLNAETITRKRPQKTIIDMLLGRGKFSSGSGTVRNRNNESSTIGVFAASWSPLYGLLSTRGIAISPPMAYSSNYKLFLYELHGHGIDDMHDGTKSVPAEQQNNMIEGFVLIRMILVADVVTNSVHVFHENTGELMWSYINVVPNPVQIYFPKSAVRSSNTGDYWFYVTSKNGGVYKVLFRRQATTGDLRKSVEVMVHPKKPMTAVSGLYEDPTHNNIYIADRNGHQILTYSTTDRSSTPKTLTFTGAFVKRIPDSPEYVLYTMVESQVNIPFCYELTPSGYLKYSVLCRAAEMWIIMGICLVVWVFFYKTKMGYNIRRGRNYMRYNNVSGNRSRVKMESDSLSY